MRALVFDSMSIIEVKNLSKRYEYYRKERGLIGSVKAFFVRKMLMADAIKNINFTIQQGELVGFLGPNGAGKTTTLKILSGILQPSSGEARMLGYVPFRREHAYLKQFALVVGQKNQLIMDLPAIESFLINKEIYGISDANFEAHLDELSGLLGVANILDIPVRKLSLGQRMKCELIAALIHKPKVLLLDEPTIGLDVVAQKNIRDFLKKYNQETQTTVLLTSHYMQDIRELCHRVIIMDLGCIIFDGSLDDLIRRYATHKILRINFCGDGVNRVDVERFGNVEDFTGNRCVLKIERNDIKNVAIALLSSSLPIDDIAIDEIDIDDVVRTIFKSGYTRT